MTESHSTASALPRWRCYVHGLIAAEISRMTRYYDRLVQGCSPRRMPRALARR